MKKFVEGGIHVQEIQPLNPSPADGVDPDARYRMGRSLQFRGMDDQIRTQAFSIADSMVPDILLGVDRRLTDKFAPEAELSVTKWSKDDKHIMTAVHIMSIAGFDSQYGPIENGNRTIETKHPELLRSVNSILVGSAQNAGSQLSSAIPDERNRTYAVGAIMDEVAYTIYGKLREARDERRSKEGGIVQPSPLPQEKVA